MEVILGLSLCGNVVLSVMLYRKNAEMLNEKYSKEAYRKLYYNRGNNEEISSHNTDSVGSSIIESIIGRFFGNYK